eukprot:6192782-Pleurochrysis_carterae.AAC.1
MTEISHTEARQAKARGAEGRRVKKKVSEGRDETGSQKQADELQAGSSGWGWREGGWGKERRERGSSKGGVRSSAQTELVPSPIQRVGTNYWNKHRTMHERAKVGMKVKEKRPREGVCVVFARAMRERRTAALQ